MRRLQIGDIVKVVRDETGELQDCVGKVAYLDMEEDSIDKENYSISVPYISVGVAFGKADNTTLLYKEFRPFSFGDKEIGSTGECGAWFRRNELRYSPKLNISPIRVVPE